LNTLDRHGALSASDQEDRRTFWRYYCGGIDNMAWQAARAYKQRFGNFTSWDEIEITIFPFDTLGMNDFIGRVVIPLQNTSCPIEDTCELLDKDGLPVRVGETKATLTYALAWRRLPADSRLSGCWRLHVARAQSLPGGPLGAANAFLSVVARAESGRVSVEQQSTVVQGNNHPAWNETFEVPIARRDLVPEALGIQGLGEDDKFTQLLPATKGGHETETDGALQAWRNKLTAFCAQEPALPMFTITRG